MISQTVYDFNFTALHESAHAVVAERLGGTVRAIVASAEHGHVDLDGLADESEKRAVMYLAGAVASQRYNQVEEKDNSWRRIRGLPAVRTQWAVPSKEDEAGIKRYMAANYFHGLSSAEQRERQRLETIARQLVDQYWTEICDVALALSEAERGGKARLERPAFLSAMGQRQTARPHARESRTDELSEDD